VSIYGPPFLHLPHHSTAIAHPRRDGYGEPGNRVEKDLKSRMSALRRGTPGLGSRSLHRICHSRWHRTDHDRPPPSSRSAASSQGIFPAQAKNVLAASVTPHSGRPRKRLPKRAVLTRRGGFGRGWLTRTIDPANSLALIVMCEAILARIASLARVLSGTRRCAVAVALAGFGNVWRGDRNQRRCQNG
jgi:hypothetical protein